ncbi:hypothetical protein N9980_00805 [bacterium]|nr:hypothetical protein [bacterium]
MPNQVVKGFFGGGKITERVAKAKQLRKGVHREKAKAGSEFPYLGSKNGELLFTYGQDNAPVPDGTLWAANIATAKTGYAYWHNRKKTAILASIWDEHPVNFEDLPDISELRDSKGNSIEWGPAYSWQFAAVNGTLKGLTVAYEGTANYMLAISEELIMLAANQMEESEACFPIVQLYNDPYPNADNGNPTSKHKFNLYGWGDIHGEVVEWLQEAPSTDQKKKPAAKPRRRRTA